MCNCPGYPATCTCHPTKEPTVDWSKPIQFRDLKENEIVQVFDNKDTMLIVHKHNGFHYCANVFKNGCLYKDRFSCFDVINIPPKKVKLYLVMHHDGSISCYSDEQHARRVASISDSKRYYLGPQEFDDPR